MQPYWQGDNGESRLTLYCGDAREILPRLEPVDLVVTDPPYGTGGRRRLESGQGRRPHGRLVREDWDIWDVAWLGLAKADAAMVFCPIQQALSLLQAARERGWTKIRGLYMRKPDPVPQPGGRTRWSVEPIWVLSADGFVLQGGTDVIDCSTPRIDRMHPYQKPVEALEWLIAKTQAKTILDPFCGSGTTLVAAAKLGRNAIGIEISEAYCEIARARCEKAVAQRRLVVEHDERSEIEQRQLLHV